MSPDRPQELCFAIYCQTTNYARRRTASLPDAREADHGRVPFRKAYVGCIVDRVEVDDGEIRIVGRKDVQERAVLASGGPVQGIRSLFANGAPGRMKLLSESVPAPADPG